MRIDKLEIIAPKVRAGMLPSYASDSACESDIGSLLESFRYWNSTIKATREYARGVWNNVVEAYVRRDNAAGFTRASGSTVTVTNNAENQSIFAPGLPVCYRETLGSGDFLWGIIHSYSSGTVTICGVALPTTIGEFRVGPAEKVASVPIQIGGVLTVGDDQLDSVHDTYFPWGFTKAYFVRAAGKVKIAASGADLNIMLAVRTVATNLITSVLNLAQSTNIVNTGVTIDSSTYLVNLDDIIFTNIDQIGSTLPGEKLTIMYTFVFP
jgi:hypothetical protein